MDWGWQLSLPQRQKTTKLQEGIHNVRIIESFRQWEKTTGSDNVSWQIGKEDKEQLVQPILTKEVRQRHQKTIPSEEIFPSKRGRSHRTYLTTSSERFLMIIQRGNSTSHTHRPPKPSPRIRRNYRELIGNRWQRVHQPSLLYQMPPLTKKNSNHETGQNSLPKHHSENLERSVIV